MKFRSVIFRKVITFFLKKKERKKTSSEREIVGTIIISKGFNLRKSNRKWTLSNEFNSLSVHFLATNINQIGI